jgi:FAD/FMN-containing dehydrogenase
VFDTRFDGATPVAVVAANSVGDVQKAMSFAARSGITVTARSGGHSYVGASAANGTMVIDLRHLPGGVTYDDGTGFATVSAAAAINSVQQALNANGRSIPTGTCPSVGIARLTLGGGLGADARRHGLTCDALTSVSVVLPSGEAVTASADEHADLYWALRGVGGANWGMVNITVGPDPTRCSVILATPPGDGPSLAVSLVGAIGTLPVSNTHRTLDHVAFVNYFSVGADAVRPRAFVAGSDIVDGMRPAAAQSIVAATQAWPRDTVSATAVIESLSGANQEIAPDATAFPWRRHATCIQWYVEPPSPPLIDAATDWLATAHAAVGANSAGGHVNYLEASTPAQQYFGANLPRLAALRRHYDPGALMYSAFDF